MHTNRDQIINELVEAIIQHLREKKTDYVDLPKLQVLLEEAVFSANVKEFVSTLPIESLTAVKDNKAKQAELAKSVARALLGFSTVKDALDNFNKLDKSKFILNGINWGDSIVSILEANKQKLKLNSAFKMHHVAATLATKVCDQKGLDCKKVSAIAAGMIAGMVTSKPYYLGLFYETNLMAYSLTQAKPLVSQSAGEIFDAAVAYYFLSESKEHDVEKAMLAGKALGQTANGDVAALLALVGIDTKAEENRKLSQKCSVA